jgi:DNA polymerase-1
MPKTVLLDGDVAIYRAIYGASEPLCFDDEEMPHVNMARARELIDHEVATAGQHFGAKYVIVAVSYGGDDWRKDINPDYKSNRKGKTKPLGFGRLKQYTQETYWCVNWSPLEADDMLGILATCPVKSDCAGKRVEGGFGERVIVSIDKDMRTIPGMYAKSFTGDIEVISEEDALLNFMAQVLTGDRVDGYYGVPGVGPVAAARILDEAASFEEPDLWHAVVRAYEDAEMTEDDALMNARCAYILRHGDYDHTNEKVKLWEPR